MTSRNSSSHNFIRKLTMGLTEIVLLALPLFAAFVVVSEDSKVNRKQ